MPADEMTRWLRHKVQMQITWSANPEHSALDMRAENYHPRLPDMESYSGITSLEHAVLLALRYRLRHWDKFPL